MNYNIGVVTETVATMFLVICVGYIAGKFGFLSKETQKRLSDIIICIAQPFLIVSSIINIEYSKEKLNQGFFIIGIGVIIHAITAGIAFISVLKIKNKDEKTITEFGLLFANCGFLGIPVLKALFGDIGGFWASFYIIVFNLIQWTYGMLLLGRGRSGIKMNFKKIIINYGTIPCAIGLVLFMINIKLPSPLLGAAGYIGSLCTPVSMLIIGGTIATIKPIKLITNLKVYYFCLIKLIIIPFIIISAAKLAGLEYNMILFASVMSGLPTAANVAMFAEKHEIAPDFAAHAVGMATLLSCLTLPAIIYITSIIA